MTKISDLTEIQLRQVNPQWIDDGKPTRQVFYPTKKDGGKLSLDRSKSITAKESYEKFRAFGFKSGGVYGLTPEEFKENPHPIECFSSPQENNPHHSHADFNGLSIRQKKIKGGYLRRKAIARGKMHPEQ